MLKPTWGYLRNPRTELVASPVILLYMHKVTQIVNYKTCIFAWARISWKGEGQGAATSHQLPPFQTDNAACCKSPAYRSTKPFPALLSGEISCVALKQLRNMSQFPVSASYPAWCTEAEWCMPTASLIWDCSFMQVHTQPHAHVPVHKPVHFHPKILFAEERPG